MLDAIRGARALERFDKLNLSLEDASKYKKLEQQYGPNTGVYINAAVKLKELENKTNKTYEDIIIEYEEKDKALAELDERLQDAKREEEALKNSIGNFKKLKHIQDVLQENDISESRLDQFIKWFNHLNEIGFSPQVALVLGEELAKYNMTPKQAAELVSEILQDYKNVKEALDHLISVSDGVKSDIKSLEFRRDHLKSIIASLQDEEINLKRIIATYRFESQNLSKALEKLREDCNKQKEGQKIEFGTERRRLEEDLKRMKHQIEIEIEDLTSKKTALIEDKKVIEQDLARLNEEVVSIEPVIKRNALLAALASLLIGDPMSAADKNIVFEALLLEHKDWIST